MASSDSMLVAAIDFGTTYSGCAFSFKHEFEKDPIKIPAKQWIGGQLVSLKGPTCALIKPDGNTLDSFGFDAESKYAELAEEEEHLEWYFFKRFKMMLFDNIGICRDIKIEDANGRKFSAIKVFSMCIGYLKNYLLKMSESLISGAGLTNDDIHWVLTVPAIWNDAAKQFMREAAEATEVGIPRGNLTIALEPEAAYLYCRHLPVDKFVGKDKVNIGSFKPGTKFLVLDAGGITVDSTVYEVKNNDSLQELHKASGGALGGIKVDEAFKLFLNKLFGATVIQNWMKDNRMYDYIDQFRNFELKKREICPNKEGKITLKILSSLTDLLFDQTGESLADAVKKGVYAKQIKVFGDKIRVDADVFKTFYDGPVKNVVDHVRDLLQKPEVRRCEAIVMVGGFSESPMLQENIRMSFPRLKVIIPDEAGIAVVKGAVIYGHRHSTYAEKVSNPVPIIPLVVAAIDFGTTYSGCAFSFRHEFEKEPTKVSPKQWIGEKISLKAPTCALINPDGETLHSFGFEAESKYAELADDNDHKEWYYFKHFKMKLFNQIGINRDIVIEDANGRTFPAKKVFSLCIGYLKDDLIKMSEKQIGEGGLTIDDIHWVLTVPAIWNDAAKQFMREAAESPQAGIPRDKLSIALEPEAASLYCRHLPVEKFIGEDKMQLGSFKPGTKYLVLDVGGGTVDITVHEVKSDDKLKEIYKASGGEWGGIKVDEAFRQFLIKIFGGPVIESLKENRLDAFMDLFREFELNKRKIGPSKEKKKITVKLPSAIANILSKRTGESVADVIQKSTYANQIKIMGDKMRVDEDVFKVFFDGPVKNIVNHVSHLLQEPSVRGCEVIVMVGGFSESPILQESIKTNFPGLKVIIPDEAGLAVLKGAVIYGHSPTTIDERVSKYTYGTDSGHTKSKKCNHPPGKTSIQQDGSIRCDDIFSIHVRVGDTVNVGEELDEQVYVPASVDQTSIGCDIFATSSVNPHLITEPGSQKIGTFSVPLPLARGTNRSVGMSMKFGGTEIEVKVVDKTTGKMSTKFVNFLG